MPMSTESCIATSSRRISCFVMAVLSAQSASVATRQRDMVRAQAYKYMERLNAVPYGTNVDPSATSAEIAELFIESTGSLSFARPKIQG